MEEQYKKATTQETNINIFAPYPDDVCLANDINKPINMIDDTTVGVMLS